jgi:hypothetical protein
MNSQPGKKDETGGQAFAVFVDAVEEGKARLVQRRAGGEVLTYTVPAELLPPGIGEGRWIELRIQALPGPPASTDDPGALRKRLLEGDDGGDISL